MKKLVIAMVGLFGIIGCAHVKRDAFLAEEVKAPISSRDHAVEQVVGELVARGYRIKSFDSQRVETQWRVWRFEDDKFHVASRIVAEFTADNQVHFKGYCAEYHDGEPMWFGCTFRPVVEWFNLSVASYAFLDY